MSFKIIEILLNVVVIIYLISSFYILDFNITNWDQEFRYKVIIWYSVVSITSLTLTGLINFLKNKL